MTIEGLEERLTARIGLAESRIQEVVQAESARVLTIQERELRRLKVALDRHEELLRSFKFFLENGKEAVGMADSDDEKN